MVRELLKNFQSRFDPLIVSYLEEQVDLGEELNLETKKATEELLRLVKASGKRIRPALVYFGYLLGGGRTENKKVLDLGIATELLHTYLLIHDDIMDKQELRRGELTTKPVYTKRLKSDHLGLVGAILVGDYARELVDEVFDESLNDLDLEKQKEIRKIFNQMKKEVVAGQIDDCLDTGISDLDDLTEEKVLKMINYKSGRYSIQKPLMLGACYAGLSQKDIDILADIGEKLGLVFQLGDDLLDLFGNEAVTGKVGADIGEGKRTLLMAKLYNQADKNEKEEIKRILGNSDATKGEIAWIKDLMIKKGVVEAMEKECQNMVSEAKDLLNNNFDKNNEGFAFVSGLAGYLLVREK